MNKKETVTNQNHGTLPVVAAIVLMFAYVVTALLGKYLLSSEFSDVLRWWATLGMLGIVCFPLTNLIFSGFHDGGWMFSKTIGLALCGWILWVLSSLHILKFTRINALIVAVVMAVLCYGGSVLIKKNQKASAWEKTVRAASACPVSQKVVLAALFELVFLLIFILACYVKCYNPDAYGTEKMMDYGFMTSLMRTEYMPPHDLWYAGQPLNYYYLGQYFAAFLTRLSGVQVNSGYNLMLAALCALCFSLVYSIVYEVMQVTIRLRREKNKKQSSGGISHVAGVLSGIAVTFAGNMHYTIFGKIIPSVQNMLGLEVSSYWFPDATRYIGYNPDTSDKTIHEFPSYSFVLGDLHAHVTNIMFVLTVVGILFAWLLYRQERMELVKEGRDKALPYSRWIEVFHPAVLAVGFFIGLFMMTNVWDFPIYYVVAGAIILFSNAVIHKFQKETLILTAFHGGLVLAEAILVSFLFNLHFDSMSHGIAICLDHTPFYQLMVLWGLPLLVLVLYLVSLLGAKKKEKEYAHGKKALPWLYQFINRLTLPELFILTIGLCAAGLVLMPELVYVVDIYGGHKRANTMFKLTYQAFILFGIMMGYVITKFTLLTESKKQICGGIVTGCLLLGTVGYLNVSIESWFGDVTDTSRFKGLDAAAFVDSESLYTSITYKVNDSDVYYYVNSSYDAEAIDWINENIKGTPVILEACGSSYTYAGRISVLTGLPSVMGWFTHEWLWRDYDEAGGYAVALERTFDVERMYLSSDADEIRALVNQYEVEYIYIGQFERECKWLCGYGDAVGMNLYEQNGGINTEALLSLGDVVFQNKEVTIIHVQKTAE